MYEEHDPDDVLVTLDHPFGELEVTLARWMAVGPGPRPLVRPIAVRSRSTGQELPMSVVPLAYRNDANARALFAAGKLKWPWA
jgi:hypothetical protein